MNRQKTSRQARINYGNDRITRERNYGSQVMGNANLPQQEHIKYPQQTGMASSIDNNQSVDYLTICSTLQEHQGPKLQDQQRKIQKEILLQMALQRQQNLP